LKRCLQCVWHDGVVRIEHGEHLAVGLANPQIVGNVLPRVLLLKITDWKIRHFGPRLDHFFSVVGRTVVHKKPFKLRKGLFA
jgi:hypothetical protein